MTKNDLIDQMALDLEMLFVNFENSLVIEIECGR